MRISKLSVQNYRTLANLDIDFPRLYSAICGKNDSGKTNVVRAIRCLMKEDDPFSFPFPQEPTISFKEDFTKWVDTTSGPRSIYIGIQFVIDPEQDTALHEFLVDYLSLDTRSKERSIQLKVDVSHTADKQAQVVVNVEDKTFKELKAQEVLKRLQTSRTFLFHSSTDKLRPFRRGFRGGLRDISEEYTTPLEKAKKAVNRALKK